MSGHSKWKNIMHKKEKTDAQRANVFTKVGKEIAMAVRDGGPDPVANSRLRDLIIKAKGLNVPNDNIDRIIKKASGADGVVYEAVTYEGYGAGGVAVIVETTTDNRNRTAAEVRHYFDKFGGNLGSTGCVSYMFADRGIILIETDADEDKFMEDALDCGAIDFNYDDGIYEVSTDISELSTIRDAFVAKGYKVVSAEVEKIPSTYVDITDEDQLVKLNRLFDMLEDNDDVQNVWHNLQSEDD